MYFPGLGGSSLMQAFCSVFLKQSPLLSGTYVHGGFEIGVHVLLEMTP